MVDEQTVWQEVWPPVEQLIQATLAEDNRAIRPAAAVRPAVTHRRN